jgi:hypothetical protein
MVGAAMALALLSLAAEDDSASANETVWSCGLINAGGRNKVFAAHAVAGLSVSNTCASGGSGLSIDAPTDTVGDGKSASWSAVAPSGLTIVLAYVDPPNLNAYEGGDYRLAFYWAGSDRTLGIIGNGSVGISGLHTNYLGFSATCQLAPSCSGFAHLAVSDIGLQAQETQGPWLSSPTGLWQSSGYIRGVWPLRLTGDSPSGICALSARLSGQTVAVGVYPQDRTTWHQCNAAGDGGLSAAVDSSRVSNGGAPLTIEGHDSAGLSTPDAFYTRTVYIDNQPPGLSFAGSPTDVPSTAGVQHVDVAGTAGLSGVSQLSCSLDDAPWQSWTETTVRVAVSGVGVHHLTCTASNRAKDASGIVATSEPQTWTLSIRQPTISAIGFSAIVSGLRCRSVRERVRVPSHWVTVSHQHKARHLRVPARSRTVRVTRCHARTERRTISVLVTVRRHGRKLLVRRTRTVQVAVPTHAVTRTSERIPYGRGATINGWLGTTGLTALGGQTVSVLSAPDDGRFRYTPAAVTSTARDGSWSVRLPAGPSRLVLASYGGGPVTEPTLSSPARMIVPARVRLISVTPRVAWGGTVRIVGQLAGGYLPLGGALVRLRIGQGSGYVTYGVQEHVTGNGRFSTSYTFGAGIPSVFRSYWFQIGSLPIGNYPYAPGFSRRLSVIVGGHPGLSRNSRDTRGLVATTRSS